MSLVRTLAPFLLATSLTACAFDGSGVGESGDLASQLEGRAFLDLAPTTTVGVCAYGADGNELPYVEPKVQDGRAVLRTTADGWLLVEDLDIQLDDVTIPAGQLGPDPVVLTNVELHLGTQLAVQPFWSGGGDAAWGTGEADLLLDWALVLDDGTPWALATQRLGAAEFTVGVELTEDGSVVAHVNTAVAGEFHELTGLVTLADLSVAVDAVSPTID
jgi:hypothetical protein